MAFKKYKKGKISKSDYEDCFISDKVLHIDSDTGDPIVNGEHLNDMVDDDDSEDIEVNNNNSKVDYRKPKKIHNDKINKTKKFIRKSKK